MRTLKSFAQHPPVQSLDINEKLLFISLSLYFLLIKTSRMAY